MSNLWDWLSSMGGIINGAVSDAAHGQINIGGVNVEDKYGRSVFDAQFLLNQHGIYCSVQPLGETCGFLSMSKDDRNRAVGILIKAGFEAWKVRL